MDNNPAVHDDYTHGSAGYDGGHNAGGPTTATPQDLGQDVRAEFQNRIRQEQEARRMDADRVRGTIPGANDYNQKDLGPGSAMIGTQIISYGRPLRR